MYIDHADEDFTLSAPVFAGCLVLKPIIISQLAARHVPNYCSACHLPTPSYTKLAKLKECFEAALDCLLNIGEAGKCAYQPCHRGIPSLFGLGNAEELEKVGRPHQQAQRLEV